MDRSRWVGFGVVPVLFAAGMFGSSACGSTVVSGTGGSGGEGGSTTGTDTATTNTTNTGGAPVTTTSTSISTTTTTTATTTSTTTTTTGTGGADPWTGPVEALKELDLGDIGFGVQTSFPVPDKTLGLTVQVEGVAADSVVGVYRLRPPVGSSVIINFAMTGKSTQVFGGLGVIGAANPQSDTVDAWPVKAGAWKVTTGSDGNAGDQAHVRVWVRRTEDGQFHGGVVDVNLWVVPGVASSNYMSQVLDAFFPYAGLEIGTFTNLSADAAFGTIGSVDEYYSMLKATGGMPNEPAINLFVVDDFSDAAYGGAIGVAGGVPGSPMRHGTRQSGLAYEPSGDPNYDATILMHEIGHVAGLFHTTEFQITETDPLSDTPECDAATIQNNPGQCADKSNTMFPIAYGATAFTNAQLNVIRGSAIYRGILTAGGQPAPPFAWPGSGAGAPPLKDPFVDNGPWAVMPTSPDALEQVLGALWCSGRLENAAMAVAQDPAAKLSRASAQHPSARLRAVVLDASAPVLLRKRALGLYVTAAKKEGAWAEALSTLLNLASDATAATANRRMRTAALRLLIDVRASAKGLDLKKIDAAIDAAKVSSDTLVAHVAAGQ